MRHYSTRTLLEEQDYCAGKLKSLEGEGRSRDPERVFLRGRLDKIAAELRRRDELRTIHGVALS